MYIIFFFSETQLVDILLFFYNSLQTNPWQKLNKITHAVHPNYNMQYNKLYNEFWKWTNFLNLNEVSFKSHHKKITLKPNTTNFTRQLLKSSEFLKN